MSKDKNFPPAPRITHSHKPWYNNAACQPQIKVKKVKNTARDKNQSNAVTKEENISYKKKRKKGGKEVRIPPEKKESGG